MPHHNRIQPLSTDKAYYGVWFETEEEGLMDHIAGMAVEETEGLPESFVAREVPAATYAVFECSVGTIGKTWDEIYRQWLPSSEYEADLECASFEYYPPDTSGND